MQEFTNLSDLHRHLDGSLRPSTLKELAQQAGITLPEQLLFFKGMGLQDALSRFATTLSVLQSPQSVSRVASEICDDAETEGVTSLEIRFAPQLHKGASMETIVDAALEGINQRAGLILCGLYGESPELIDNLVTMGASRPGVVGIDLAGGPAPNHSHGLRDYASAFSRAKAQGLGRTVHAGEGRSPQEIRDSIIHLHAQRIGHGTTLLKDSSVVDLVLERNVTIEACPTSNVHTSAISNLENHPLKEWMNLGISVCINTDNTFFSDVTSSQEYQRVAAALNLSDSEILTLCQNGHQSRFGLN